MRLIRSGSLILVGTMLGCMPPAPPSAPSSIQPSGTGQPSSVSPTSLPASAPHDSADRFAGVTEAGLKQQIDDVLHQVLTRRQLNTDEHGAWQIMHGVLSYQHQFPVRVGQNGPVQSAIQYALGGGQIDGWVFEPGRALPQADGRRGLRAVLQPGTRRGQGHPDQWLAILAQCDLPRDQPIIVGDQAFQLGDLVAQCQADLPYNVDREYSWTLIGLSQYVPSHESWKADDGELWDLQKLVRIELDQSLEESACGGTHRMIGVATALQAHREAGGPLSGIWTQANARIQDAIRRTLAMQNPDGTFSSQYFSRPSRSADMAITLGTTGHLLEFLAVAMTDPQLQDPQLQRAAQALCDLFDTTQHLALECGAMYHATHGLMLYRQRRFGKP